MRYIHTHSRKIYFLIFTYSVFVLLISSLWDIGNFFPRPLFEVTNYLLDWMVFSSESSFAAVSLILLVVLLLIVWIPMSKNNSIVKKLSCVFVALFCLFDAVLLIYYGSCSHDPLSLRSNDAIFDKVFVCLDTICDLFMAFIAFVRISFVDTLAPVGIESR